MKVLFVHNFYQKSGGEDKVVDEEINLLRQNGVEVAKYFISNDEIELKGLANKISLGVNTIWSKKQYNKSKTILRKEKPNVVHFHNTFPLLSPAVYYACHSLQIPVVQTLHNYRLACPGAMFLREGEICEKCVSGSLLNSVKHGCYRNSTLQTIPLSMMLYIHRFSKTWSKKVDKYIALTQFAKRKFEQIGIDENKIFVKPNFINRASNGDAIKNKENSIVFVGRISKEKGLHLLLEAWSNICEDTNFELNIIGEGPLQEALVKKYNHIENVKFLGKLNSNDVLEYMSKAKYTIVPSVWYEGFPMTIIESYSVNTPVISSNIGSLKEVVVDEVTGFHFANDDVKDLEKVLIKALNYENYHEFEKHIKKQYEKNYTPNANFELLMGIYNEVIKEKKSEK